MKHIIFSDFDDTICTSDSTAMLIDRCIGKDARVALDQQMLRGEIGFREAVTRMWDGVDLTREESEEILKDIQVDPGFVAFATYCTTHHIPLIILSSGLTWLVTLCMTKFLGPSHATSIRQIVANDVHISEHGKWTITWVDDTAHGHDKARSIRGILAAEEKGEGGGEGLKTFYVGDGVSDISAARECDVLFAKRGLDLEKWCVKAGVTYRSWSHFGDVQQMVEGSIGGET